MEKTYNPKEIEQQWYKIWEEQGYFKPKDEGKPYCIMIPPPNVTGTLHMGHGFQYALMDTLIRYHRMRGYKTLWQVGYDHAGIATQMIVERQLQKQGISRHDLGRDKFVEKIWQWREKSGNLINQQMRRIGISVDWDRERFTMDEGLSEAVREVFVKLHEEGLIYRGKRLINWDPKLLTAISDLEVLSEEEPGHLWHMRYPLVNGTGHVIVATTRPETLLGDVAVAVHPEDERYQELIGQSVHLPLTDRTIPIIADPFVEKEFGSGCVKITPAHDFNDYQVGKNHELPLINIFTPDAKLNDNAPEQYQGMDRFDARKKIVKALEAKDLLEKVENYTVKIPRGDRSGVVVEPYLTDQWFVKADVLAQKAAEVVEQGAIQFVPSNWSKTYFQWMHNIEDWCISRQLWWGHRIPAWYDKDGNIYVGHDEAAVREKYDLAPSVSLRQDDDVLDTWFSSALWPFSTLGWPERTQELETFYPTTTLVTGFDIIFFWVARMIMFGLKFTQQIPFHEIYITGLIKDSEGQKMSKSKGNVIDPLDLVDGIDLKSLIEKRTSSLLQPQMAKKITQDTKKHFPEGIPSYGTDALRFTYCALASTGRDVRFELSRLEGYRNFCNKIWNATRYVLMNTQDHELGIHDSTLELRLADKWILSKLQLVIGKVHETIKNYRFDLLAQTLYEFTWNEYCDWYLELSKPILFSENEPEKQKATRNTLVTVLESLLRLIHPIMPFITEEIWQRIGPMAGKTGKTIMLEAFPEVNEALIDDDAEQSVEWLKQVIVGIRTIRGEMNISPSKPITAIFHKGSPQDQQRLNDNQQFIMNLAKLSQLDYVDTDQDLPLAATALVGEMEILIPMKGLIDIEAEISRLQKELEKITKELERSTQKLANENFIARAPAEVVKKEHDQVAELNYTQKQLIEKIEQLSAIGS